MAELRKLADCCQFGGYLEEALRDRLVCGLRDEAIQRKLLTMDALTLSRAYEITHGMETAQRQASELQASTKVGHHCKSCTPVESKDPQNRGDRPVLSLR